MSEHTPGPWKLVIGAGSKGYAGNYEIVTAVDAEHEANTRLIAAAPDLLEACEAALFALEGQGPIAAQCRAAIAKAKGESNE